MFVCMFKCPPFPECVCVCLHMYTFERKLPPQADGGGDGGWLMGGGDTSKLHGIGALRGLRDNTGLTDPTKWPIMSQWRNLGSKNQILPLSLPWISGHTNTRTGEGEAVAYRAVQRVEAQMVVSSLDQSKRGEPNSRKDQTRRKGVIVASDNQQKEAVSGRMSKLTRKCAGLCVCECENACTQICVQKHFAFQTNLINEGGPN